MYSRTTEHLEQFDNQHDFERMCADILNALGNRDVVPIAPRGGNDGGQDITFTTASGEKGLACVTLRKDIDAKFREDFHQRKPGEYSKYMLFCTAYITAAKKIEFVRYCLDSLQAEFVPQDIEALRSLLDSALKPIRAQYLYNDDALTLQTEGRRDLKLSAAFTDRGIVIQELKVARRHVRIPTIQQYQDELAAAAARLSKDVDPSNRMTVSIDSSIEFSPHVPPVQPEIERLIAQIVQTTPHLAEYGDPPYLYLRRYAHYLDYIYRCVDFRARSYPIGLRALNTGTAAAQDVIVEVVAPANCHVRPVGLIPDTPREPQRPFRLTIGALGFSRNEPSLPSSVGMRRNLQDEYPSSKLEENDVFRGPIPAQDESHRVTYDVRRVLHNVPVDLALFVLMVPRGWNGDVVRVECLVHADGQPRPAQVHLDVIAGETTVLHPWEKMGPFSLYAPSPW